MAKDEQKTKNGNGKKEKEKRERRTAIVLVREILQETIARKVAIAKVKLDLLEDLGLDILRLSNVLLHRTLIAWARTAILATLVLLLLASNCCVRWRGPTLCLA